MLEEWTHLPRIVKLGIAVALLGGSSFAAWQGRVWPWGFGIGGLLFIMSFMQPLGPPRKKYTPPSTAARPSDPEVRSFGATTFEGSANPNRQLFGTAAPPHEESRSRRRARPNPVLYIAAATGVLIVAIAVVLGWVR